MPASQFRLSASWPRFAGRLPGLQARAPAAQLDAVVEQLVHPLNDFLFDTARSLSTMRSRVQEVGDDPSDSARHHVYQSNLTRAFHTVQAAHHRFEFAAGALETPDNFRLDAAMKSARGLRRRSQDRIQEIEARLEAKAAERARQRHALELAEAEQFIDQVRSATDRTVDELIALQEELNLDTEASEAFLRAVLRAEVATSRLEIARTDRNQIEDRLRSLAAERVARAKTADVELVSCDVAGRPVNLDDRLRTGGVAGILTLITALLGQYWITRRA